MSLSKNFTEAREAISDWLEDLKAPTGVPKWLLYGGLAAGLGLLAGAGYLYSNPGMLMHMGQRCRTSSAGFTVKYKQGNKYRYCYAERGQLRSDKPSLLFVHGFGGSKEAWMGLCKSLPSDIHVVCIDLPAHGETSIPTNMEDASLYAMVDILAEFVQLLNMVVVPHHVVGVSMGGAVAALYAAKYPQAISKLTLMAPAMQCPIETEILEIDDEPGQKSIFSDDPAVVKSAVEKAFYNTDLLPKKLWVYKAMIKLGRPKKKFLIQFHHNMIQEVITESTKYESLLSTIKAPTQLLWGEEDEMVHVSGASLLEELIPTVKVIDILPQCGHALAIEQPEAVCKLLIDFYNAT